MLLLRDTVVDGSISDILIHGPVIERIAPAGTIIPTPGTEVMQCSGMTAIPGFINMHTHAAMTLMRGMGEDMCLGDWLPLVWSMEDRIDGEFVYWGTRVACLEMARTGTTMFNDQYWHTKEARQAVKDAGLSAALAYTILDNFDKEKAARQRDECISAIEESRTWDDSTMLTIGVHSVYTVSSEMISWAAQTARKYGLKLHIHMSETQTEVKDCMAAHGGMTPVEYLDDLGFLGPDVIAAHAMWLSPGDIEILSRRGVNCVHNINSNAKLSSGYRFLYNELHDAGVNVCLGTDGCASSNNLDMLETAKTAALFQKAWRRDAAAMPLHDCMDMLTVNGARALGLDSRGRLEQGCRADISLVNTDNTFFLSPAPFEANLIYSAHSDCIDTVIAGGRVIMQHRHIDGEKDIIDNARKVLSKII